MSIPFSLFFKNLISISTAAVFISDIRYIETSDSNHIIPSDTPAPKKAQTAYETQYITIALFPAPR